MVIYADVMFFINLIFDYMALMVLGKIMKLRVRQWRIAASGALGAAGTVMLFCMDVSHVFLKLLLALVMIICAYGFSGKRTLSVFAAFLLIMAAVSGVVTAAVSVISTGTDSVIKNGIVYFDISGALLFIILLAAYPIICILSKGMRERRNRTVYLAEIERSGEKVTLSALFDSGNKLKEPITKRPVVVAEWESVRALFETDAEFETVVSKSDEYRLWVIPYHALGNSDGIIFAFLADRIQVDKRVTERVFIGITDQKFSNEYQALLNADLI